MKRYALVIDEEACWGCKTCEVACKQEFNPPDGVTLIRVWEDGPKMVGGRLSFVFRVNVCRHCEDPPCAEVCPAEAISKRDDGIVILDEQECTGCGQCVDACPFDSVTFDSDKNVARKCNLCYERVDKGLLPACADNVCLAHCIHFGEREKVTTRLDERCRRSESTENASVVSEPA